MKRKTAAGEIRTAVRNSLSADSVLAGNRQNTKQAIWDSIAMGTGKQRVFIESSSKLKNGLHDGTIEKAGASGQFLRISLGVRTDAGDLVRIDFEIQSPDYPVNRANQSQFDRLLKVVNVSRPHDTKELLGKRIGLRIDKGRFIQFESPLIKEVIQ